MELEQLFAEEAWLRRLAGRLAAHDPATADDLVQETWIAALRRPPSLDRPVRPWLSRVVRNLAHMRFRGETRREAREVDAAPEATPSPEALALRLEAHRHLAGLILALEESQRQVILLCFGEGLSSAEVAARLRVPAGTVRWRLKRALDELRRKLGVDIKERRVRGFAVFWKGILAMKVVKIALAVVVLLLLGLLVAPRVVGRTATHSAQASATVSPRAPATAEPSRPGPARKGCPRGSPPAPRGRAGSPVES